jgi:hypothetical protein
MPRVLFLGGLGRSGTTLLERILGELPGVVALGEVVHLWQRDLRDGERCGCGAPFAGCRFWQAIGEVGFGGWHRVDIERVLHLQRLVERTRHIPLLAAGRRRALLREYTGYYQRVYTAAAEVASAQVVVDSSKHSALAWCLSHTDLDLRIAHLVRDPRGVAYSWTKRVARPETDLAAPMPSGAGKPLAAPMPSGARAPTGAAQMTRYPPARSALLWNTHNAALGLLARRGVPVARMRYEQFLANPRRGLRTLAAFAGLDLSTADLRFLDEDQVRLGPCHSAAGNPMRFTVGTVALHRDDAWRRELPGRHRHLVGALCAPLLAAYGYPLRPTR